MKTIKIDNVEIQFEDGMEIEVAGNSVKIKTKAVPTKVVHEHHYHGYPYWQWPYYQPIYIQPQYVPPTWTQATITFGQDANQSYTIGNLCGYYNQSLAAPQVGGLLTQYGN